jgi:hypothetical protein
MARDYPKNQKQSDNIFNRDTNPQTRMTGRCTKSPPWTVALLPVSLSATYLGAALREIGMCGGEPAGTVRTSPRLVLSRDPEVKQIKCQRKHCMK